MGAKAKCKVQLSKVSILNASIIELQQNGGREVRGSTTMLKGLPFTMDFELGKNVKELTALIIKGSNEFTEYGKKIGIIFKTMNNGGVVSLQYDIPEGFPQEKIEDFKKFEDSIWNSDNEIELYTYSATELHDVVFVDCPNKNTFFEYLVKE